MRNRVIHRNSPFRLLAAALAVLTLTLLAVMVPCEGEAHAAAPIKIACVGDSLTDGSKSSGGKKGDTAYPAWLGRILGSGYDVRNFGAAGDTLLRGTGWSYWDSAEFRQSKEFAPISSSSCSAPTIPRTPTGTRHCTGPRRRSW